MVCADERITYQRTVRYRPLSSVQLKVELYVPIHGGPATAGAVRLRE